MLSVSRSGHAEKPIEAGWQALQAKLSEEFSPLTLEKLRPLLRFVFFHSAQHYRSMVKELFEVNDDGETLCQTLHNIAAELAEWEREQRKVEAP